MIKLTITQKNKPSFCAYFKTVEDARAFTNFEMTLIENVKKKTLEAKA